MREPGKLKQIIREMENYRLDILGLSEVRWDDFGELKSQAGVTLLYSGRAHGETARDGVGLLLSKRARRGLMEWYPISERIIIARFQNKIRNINVVQCYAPTETSEEVVKQEFYVALTDVLKKIKRKDVILLMGDFNAKVGQENEGLEHIMGKHGLGERNENGEFFVNLCASHDLVIGGTLFPHKDCHKVTWVSPDHRTENQIDHVAISRKWRHSLQDVRNKRGADVGTDHHLVMARLKFKISVATRRFQRRSRLYDVAKLKKKPTIEAFRIQLKNRFEALDLEAIEGVEETWEAVKKTFIETCEDSLGHRELLKKEWMSDETWEKINQRRETKQLILNSKTRLT